MTKETGRRLTGEGDVLVNKTGAHVAQARYDVTVTSPGGGPLARIDADISLDEHLARRLLTAGDLLTLRIGEGRSFDFYVQAVSGSGPVTITATGAVRSEV